MDLELIWGVIQLWSIKVGDGWPKGGVLHLFHQEGKSDGLEELLRRHKVGLLREGSAGQC